MGLTGLAPPAPPTPPPPPSAPPLFPPGFMRWMMARRLRTKSNDSSAPASSRAFWNALGSSCFPARVYDELREGLVRDSYVVLELRRHLIHQRQVRKLVERRHRVRAACPSDALCHLALQSGREDSVRKPSPKCSFGFGAKLSGIAKLAKLPTIRT